MGNESHSYYVSRNWKGKKGSLEGKKKEGEGGLANIISLSFFLAGKNKREGGKKSEVGGGKKGGGEGVRGYG